MPTYNCAPLMERHLESMAAWADLADEIIVVDSRSTDGTLDLIRSRLHHPNLRIIERPRGLYESWNEGIAATTGEWVYISTAGDTIERAHLLHLQDLGERAGADVVISPPRFVDENGVSRPALNWPPAKVVSQLCPDGPIVLSKNAAITLSYLFCPSSLLGSSASNLYRGSHMRGRPFPVGFRGAGDTAWIMRHAMDTRVCVTPDCGSSFSVHAKAEPTTSAQQNELILSLIREKRALLTILGESVDARFHREAALFESTVLCHLERRRLWREGILNPVKATRWLILLGRYLSYRLLLGMYRRALMKRLKQAGATVRLSQPTEWA
jgi:hypothetical protein